MKINNFLSSDLLVWIYNKNYKQNYNMKPKFQKCHFVPVHTKLSFISGAIRKGIGSCAVVHVIMKLSFILSSRGKLQCPFTIDLKYVGEGWREREREAQEWLTNLWENTLTLALVTDTYRLFEHHYLYLVILPLSGVNNSIRWCVFTHACSHDCSRCRFGALPLCGGKRGCHGLV